MRLRRAYGKGHKIFPSIWTFHEFFLCLFEKCKEFKANRRSKEVIPWLDFSNNNCSQGLVRHLVRLHDARSPTTARTTTTNIIKALIQFVLLLARYLLLLGRRIQEDTEFVCEIYQEWLLQLSCVYFLPLDSCFNFQYPIILTSTNILYLCNKVNNF